jgi:hypothetical protein
VRSDFDLVSGGALAALLAGVLGAEARLLALRVPFGVSLLCVARRPVVVGEARARGRATRETSAFARETR